MILKHSSKTMSKELSKIDKLASLDELHFLLLEVLNDIQAIQKEDLSALCLRKSVNLRFSFENTLLFLNILSIIDFTPDGSIRKSRNINWEDMKSHQELAALILTRIFNYLENNGQLDLIFGERVMVLEQRENLIVLYSNRIPLHFSCIKIFLLNAEIALIDRNLTNRLIISKEYQEYFKPILLPKNEPPKATTETLIPESQSDEIQQPGGFNLFISYSHKDEDFKNELMSHFKGMIDKGTIKAWEGRAILPGQDWDLEIKKKLEEATVILFLVSSAFMDSDYIKDVEIKHAIERYDKKEVKIVPVILRPCDFDSLPLNKHLAVPTGRKPISRWDDRDEAYLDVVNHIKRMLGLT